MTPVLSPTARRDASWGRRVGIQQIIVSGTRDDTDGARPQRQQDRRDREFAVAKKTSDNAKLLGLSSGIWPPLPPNIRRLEDAEIDVLEHTLPENTKLEREWFRTRFIKLVADIIRLSDRPSPRDRCDSVVQLAADPTNVLSWSRATSRLDKS